MASTEPIRKEKTDKPTSDSIITIGGGGGGFVPKDKKPKKAKFKFDKDHFDYDAKGELNSKKQIVASKIRIESGDLDVTLPITDEFEVEIIYEEVEEE